MEKASRLSKLSTAKSGFQLESSNAIWMAFSERFGKADRNWDILTSFFFYLLLNEMHYSQQSSLVDQWASASLSKSFARCLALKSERKSIEIHF